MNAQRFTMAEATAWPIEEMFDDATPIYCLDFTPDEAKATGQAWAWLLNAGMGGGSAHTAAYDQALSDGDIFLALNRPATEWLTWFRRTDWELFGRADCCPPGAFVDSWAWGVIDSTWAVLEQLGAGLAGQVSMVEAVRRFRAHGAHGACLKPVG